MDIWEKRNSQDKDPDMGGCRSSRKNQVGVAATDGGRALQRGGFDHVEPGDLWSRLFLLPYGMGHYRRIPSRGVMGSDFILGGIRGSIEQR